MEFTVVALDQRGDDVPDMTKHFATLKSALFYYSARLGEHREGTHCYAWILVSHSLPQGLPVEDNRALAIAQEKLDHCKILAKQLRQQREQQE
jgi:hypothetical protein